MIATVESKVPEQQRMKKRPSGTLLNPLDEFEHWFDDFFPRGWMQPIRRGWRDLEFPFEHRMPKVDLIERDADIVVRAEIPGVNKDGLDVSLTEHSVTIKATSRKEQEEGEYYLRELSHREYQRTVSLPENVNGDKAKANLRMACWSWSFRSVKVPTGEPSRCRKQKSTCETG